MCRMLYGDPLQHGPIYRRSPLSMGLSISSSLMGAEAPHAFKEPRPWVPAIVLSVSCWRFWFCPEFNGSWEGFRSNQRCTSGHHQVPWIFLGWHTQDLDLQGLCGLHRCLFKVRWRILGAPKTRALTSTIGLMYGPHLCHVFVQTRSQEGWVICSRDDGRAEVWVQPAVSGHR